MRILIVAPEGGLDTVGELYEAAGGNRPEFLTGTVTVREVQGHIASGAYDAVHFAGHGTREALQMSDGYLDMEQLESALSAADRTGHPVKIVVLNACASIRNAVAIYGIAVGGPSFVIGWRQAELPDRYAKEFAMRFWQAMRYDNEDVHQAFDSAVYALRALDPTAEVPLLLNGRIDDLRNAMRALTHELTELTDT